MPTLSELLPLVLNGNSPGFWSAAVPQTLNEKLYSVLPKPEEERWQTVGWRANLMAAREEAQRAHKPVFLWIMVGNPQGCT